jgi:hypothetical protein
MACREALALAKDLRLQLVVVVSYFLQVINNLKEGFCR